MSTRKIIVFSSKTNSKIELTVANTPDIESINTWGQLKPKVTQLIGNDMIATSVQTRSVLSSDSSVVTFDATTNIAQIVLTPAKVKSGVEQAQTVLLIKAHLEAIDKLIDSLSTATESDLENIAKEIEENG
jgi:hypothetical protein